MSTKFKAIGNSIVFRWIDSDLEEHEFQLQSGIVVTRKPSKKRMRWGKVLAVGTHVSTIKQGDYIVPEKSWGWDSPFIQQVEGCKVDLDGEFMPLITIYKTLEEWCLIVTDDITATYNLDNDSEHQEAIDLHNPDNWDTNCKI